jgi:SAM-dependent methyltransferase
MIATEAYNVSTNFSENYLALREKEKRLYTDEELLQLPSIETNHQHFNEWVLRKESFNRLKQYLAVNNKALKILEVGCGNGWLSHRLSAIPISQVTGCDINQTELLQAKKVFSHIPNLRFIYGDIHAAEIANEKFDYIIFASCIQYFNPLEEIINTALQKLNPGGGIHILDSPIYQRNELGAAKERTKNYFKQLGFPEMSNYYFHYCFDELSSYQIKTLYRPGFINRLFVRNKSPFPWICINKQ